MSSTLRFLLLSSMAAVLPLAAGASLIEELSVARAIEPQLVASIPGFDYCLKDQGSNSILHFNSTTGAYVVCGADGVFEQGVGVVLTAGGVITLSHTLIEREFNGFETVHATVNTATHQGQAAVRASNENQGAFTRFSITDPNVNSSPDCSTCGPESGADEGVINFLGTTSNALGVNNTVTQFTVIQKYSLNSDFSGNLSRLSAGISRNGPGALAFQFALYSDNHGQPGDVVYLGPMLQYPSFPAFPTIGIVQQDIDFSPGPVFWAGIRWNPATDPLYIPFDASPTSPKTDVFVCGSSGPCEVVSSNPTFAQLRNIFHSADYKYPTLYQSAGFVRYDGSDSSDIISSKSFCSYTRFDLNPHGLYQLYAENGRTTTFPVTDFSKAFARITPLSFSPGSGLDGIAKTKYGTMRFSGLSYVNDLGLNFCTRREDLTDYVCRLVPGFQPGTCHYSRVAGVSGGFEISCANAPADRIDRWLAQYNGSTWSTQALTSVTATPSIGSPEFGFNWYKANSLKLGVAYLYKTTSGEIETQLLNGNSFIGKYAIDTDDPPAGFNPNLATRMGGDCTRDGVCIFGRYDAHTASNVADYIDFRQSPPEIKSWILGPSPQGFGFGRAVNINGRDGTALYSSYTPSLIANQYRIQHDYVNIKSYKKFTLSYDYAAGGTNFPLSLSRADGDWGLGHAKGVSVFFSLTAGCAPDDVRSHSSGSDSGGSRGATIPCENIPLIRSRF
jgi:hypothetical protein